MRAIVAVGLVALLVFLASAHAHADSMLFEGESVRYRYRYPDTSTTLAAVDYTFTVGSGTELTDFLPGDALDGSLDISGNNIRIDFTGGAYWNTAGSFNGFQITDAAGTIDAFTSVSIASDNTLAGLTLSRITFDGDNIWIDLSGLGDTSGSNANYLAGYVLSINVNAAPVPEPASLALIGLGLAGVALARGRRGRPTSARGRV